MEEVHGDLLIQISRNDQHAYPVRAKLSNGSVFSGVLALPPEELAKLRKLAHLPLAFGEQLFSQLFQGPIANAFATARGLANRQRTPRVRVRLQFDEDLPTSIHALKWECLAEPQAGTVMPLAIGQDTPLSRYIALPHEEPKPLDSPYIHLLIVVSSPGGLETWNLAPIDVGVELQRLAQSLAEVLTSRRCRVTIMPGRQGDKLTAEVRQLLDSLHCEILPSRPLTIDAIAEQLRGKHMLHYLGHGQYVQGAGALFLEDEHDATVPKIVEEHELVVKLRDAQLQLVFLAACNSAQRDAAPEDASADAGARQGLAAALVAAGIPAVVAMQTPLSLDGAFALAGEFYRRLLLEHGSVDLALNQARKLFFTPYGGEWDTPVLYTRLGHGQLLAENPLFAALARAAAQPYYADFRRKAYYELPVHAVVVNHNQQFITSDAPALQPTGAVKLLNAVRQRLEDQNQAGRLLLVLGGPGTSKSFQLKNFAWQTIEAGLRWEEKDPPLAIFLELPLTLPGGALTAEFIEAESMARLQALWPQLGATTFGGLPAYLRLHVFVNGGDLLPEIGEDLLAQMLQLASDYPLHRFVLALQPLAIDWQTLVKAQVSLKHVRSDEEVSPLYVLAIQPMAQRTVRQYLEREHAFGGQLVDALNDAYLFDLAGIPFFMVKLLANASRQQFPISRTEYVKQILDESIARLSPGEGLRSSADRTLQALAWTMQQAQETVWPINDAFDVFKSVRERGYNLEEMFTELAKAELLQQVGEDDVRFSYAYFQAYLCAEHILAAPDREQMLAEAVARLDSAAHARWWEEVVIFVCGLLAASSQQTATRSLRRMLEPLVFGANLLEGEAAFLAARCLVECSQHRRKLGWPDLVRHVVNALQWRAESRNEPSRPRRLQAVQLLAQLAAPQVTIKLAQVAYDRVRMNVDQERDYEFSAIRFAAAVVLKRMPPEKRDTELVKINPQLPALYQAWKNQKVTQVIEFSRLDDPGLQGIAALALGDLHGRMQGDAEAARQVLDRLLAMFMDATLPGSVRWPVCDALAGLELTLFNARLIEPLLEEFSASPPARPHLAPKFRKSLIYLLGQLRLNDAKTLMFLDQCLAVKDGEAEYGWKTWVTTIGAFGYIADQTFAARLIEIAGGWGAESGSERSIPLSQLFPNPVHYNYLVEEAVAALENFGDIDLLDHTLRERLASDPLFTRLFYRMMQTLYWRQHQPRPA